jgi:hypothetical protein
MCAQWNVDPIQYELLTRTLMPPPARKKKSLTVP